MNTKTHVINKLCTPIYGNVFWNTYKVTLKTTLRSALFWVAFILALAAVFYKGTQATHGYVEILEDGTITSEMIYDTDPRYVLSWDRYSQLMLNLNGSIMLYAVPLFCAITAMISLIRDHEDNMFEIEKAYGVGAARYFFGRVLAIITLTSLVTLFFAFFSINHYYFTRGGLAQFTLWEYFCDSAVRILRVYFNCIVPATINYVSVTVLLSTLFKNGIVGGIMGIIYALTNYLFQHFWLRLDDFVKDHLDVTPQCLFNYWGTIGDPLFNLPQCVWITKGEMIFITACILGSSALMLGASYYMTIKRTR